MRPESTSPESAVASAWFPVPFTTSLPSGAAITVYGPFSSTTERARAAAVRAAANRSLWGIVVATVAIYALILAVAPLRQLFRLAAPVPADATILGVATLLLWFTLAVLNGVYAAFGSHGRARPQATH